MTANELFTFRESEHEVQEQRRLQQPGDHVRPVNCPIEVVQLAGVLESVEDKRHQAENVKVSGFGRRPTTQQNIQPYSQIDQRDQSQSKVEGLVSGREHQLGLQG